MGHSLLFRFTRKISVIVERILFSLRASHKVGPTVQCTSAFKIYFRIFKNKYPWEIKMKAFFNNIWAETISIGHDAC